MPLIQHRLDNTKTNTRTSRTFHHTNDATHFLPGWSNTSPAQSPSFHTHTDSLYSSQTVPAFPPGSSTSLTDPPSSAAKANGGAWQRSKVISNRGTPPPSRLHQMRSSSKELCQKATPKLWPLSLHQGIHKNCTWSPRHASESN